MTPSQHADVLYNIGICPECGEERQHDIEEPFSVCACGVTEDCSPAPILQRLRMSLNIAVSELEWVAGKDGGCPDGSERDCAIAALKRIESVFGPIKNLPRSTPACRPAAASRLRAPSK